VYRPLKGERQLSRALSRRSWLSCYSIVGRREPEQEQKKLPEPLRLREFSIRDRI
jgi:hypothetical protein